MFRKIVSDKDAAWRAVCLEAVGVWGNFAAEWADRDADREELEEYIQSFLAWMEDWDILKRCSHRERATLGTHPRLLDRQQAIDATWSIEALNAVLWAMGMLGKLGEYDERVEASALHELMGLPAAPVKDFVRAARLRPASDIHEARDLAEFWLWRARTTSIMHDPASPPSGERTYEQIIVSAARTGGAKGWFTPINDDFPALGKAFRDLTDAERATVSSIARERLVALNWLCRQEPDWDDITADT